MSKPTTKRLGTRRRPGNAATKASLSPLRKRLLDLMQGINFGRIEDLVVHDGEPVFDPPPRVVRQVKFCGENGPRLERSSTDFALKAQVVELFEQLDQLRNGTVESVEIKHGIPFQMNVEEPVRE